CIGIKSSALLIGPSLAVLAVYALWPRGSLRQVTGDASTLVLAGLVGVAVFALPAGYIENWRVFGHPIGPEDVRKLHAFEGEPLSYVLENGTKNLLRFGFEFLSFDGLPAGGAFVEFQRSLRQVPRSVVSSLGLDLEAQEATRVPFQYDKVPASHEDGSYWGILGFGLIWPLVLLALLGLIKATPNRVLALATMLFVLAQAYSGPYDPWRGRYFIIAAMFAVPVLACCVRAGYRAGYLKANLPWRVYLTVVVLAGCLSAFTAVLGRWSGMPEEVYAMNRLEQLTRNRHNSYDPIRRFDERVPVDATVAVCFGEDTFEYPLFGAGLTRTLIPINSFWKGLQPIPAQAGYLLYSSNEFDDQRLTDIYLGEDWYLRELGR
ncbi:MAG: hypothetical protein M1546_13530, partial [Chloroflexi bacterium]|nr:hypothetical protein [Chloroflexota bacterium]